MRTRKEDKGSYIDEGNETPEISSAVREMAVTVREAGVAISYAVHDATASVTECFRSCVELVLVTLEAGGSSNGNGAWPETHAQYARANGGRMRPLEEKTPEEHEMYERMRSKRKGGLT